MPATETTAVAPGERPPDRDAVRRRRRARRRALVLAAAGALVLSGLLTTGAWGAARYGVTFWLYRGYPAPATPKTVLVSVPGGKRAVQVVPATVERILVPGPSLAGWQDPVYVVLPPGYAEHPWLRYPVVYLLHGAPGAPMNYFSVGDLVPIDEVLVAEGRIQPMILVVPSGTRTFLADSEWANAVLPGNGWETFVAKTLVGVIDRRFRAIASGADRAIGGYSTGGYGALNIGLHHVGEFSVLESWSGYELAEDFPWVFDHSPALMRENSPFDEMPQRAAALKAHHVLIWMYIGGTDALLAQNKRFVALLGALGVTHHFLVIPGVAHTWDLWRAMLGPSLETASASFTHA